MVEVVEVVMVEVVEMVEADLVHGCLIPLTISAYYGI